MASTGPPGQGQPVGMNKQEAGGHQVSAGADPGVRAAPVAGSSTQPASPPDSARPPQHSTTGALEQGPRRKGDPRPP